MEQIILTSLPLKDLETVIIDCVNACLRNHKSHQPNLSQTNNALQEKDEILGIKEASSFLKLSIPTLYKYCGEKTIPYMKKRGEILFFRKELLKWAVEGRRKTINDLHQDTETWLGKLGQKKAINH